MINKCTACCSVWPTFKKNWGDNPPYLCRPAIHAVNHSFTMNSPFSFKHLVLFVIVKKKEKERKKSTYNIYAYANIVMNMVLKWLYYIEHVNLLAEIHCSIIGGDHVQAGLRNHQSHWFLLFCSLSDHQNTDFETNLTPAQGQKEPFCKNVHMSSSSYLPFQRDEKVTFSLGSFVFCSDGWMQ